MTADIATGPFSPVPVLLSRAPAHDPVWPVLQVGTGGVPTAQFYVTGLGYSPVRIILPADYVAVPIFAGLMEQIKNGFGRTLNRLPKVFGVTRQTLYNWLSGETPRPFHHDKIRELAAAAQVFSELGFRPTPTSLERPLLGGRSILEMVASGHRGKDAALMLVQVERRGASSRDRLAKLLGSRPKKADEVSFSAPAVGQDDPIA